MNVAIIGSGISGLTAAYYLQNHAQVTVFEKASRLGGHTATVDVELDGRKYAVDTGFIVYNERTYPNFIRMMEELGVATKPTSMGFSMTTRQGDYEYSGSGLAGMFAQKSNLFNLSHWRMLRDIVRFNRQAPEHLESGEVDGNTTLGEYLQRYNYSDSFRDYYLVPMGAAIWSAGTDSMMAFPMQFFIRFFINHGLLQLVDRPQWYVIEGGSRQYIPALTQGFTSQIRLNADIQQVVRKGQQTEVVFGDGSSQLFDQVVFACHSDEALALLADSDELEQEILQAIPYQNNEVVLHYDESLLPRRRSTWSSWNYNLHGTQQDQVTLTYDMNILQGLTAPVTFCVTLNATDRIAPDKVLSTHQYAHPVFTLQGIRAQQRWHEINGVRNTWFAGAYWRNGFHEDGVVSGMRVANGILQRMGHRNVEILDY